MRTKIFCDIADFKTIKFFNKKSIVDGFTTNPSLMRLAGAKNYKDYSLKILKVCKKKPISFEVFADDSKEMLKQAYKIIYMDAEEECKGVSAGAEKTEPRDEPFISNVAQAPNNGATRPFAPVLVLDADF